MTEIHREKKLWEVLNVVPLIELNSATPEERAEIERRAENKLRQQIERMRQSSKPVSEIFDRPSTTESSE